MSGIDEMPEGLKLAAQYEWPEGAYYVAVYGGKEVDFVSDCDRKPICSHEYSKEQHAAARQQLGLEPASVSDKTDMVNHPPHYQSDNGIECIDAIRAQMTEDQFAAYCQGNIVKYLWRWRQKAGVESLKKARWYLDRMIGELESNQ